jgi:hypothetical protein
VLYIHEETVWKTCHMTQQTDPDRVVDEVTFNPFLLGHMEGLAPDKLAACEANRRNKELLIA